MQTTSYFVKVFIALHDVFISIGSPYNDVTSTEVGNMLQSHAWVHTVMTSCMFLAFYEKVVVGQDLLQEVQLLTLMLWADKGQVELKTHHHASILTAGLSLACCLKYSFPHITVLSGSLSAAFKWTEDPTVHPFDKVVKGPTLAYSVW